MDDIAAAKEIIASIRRAKRLDDPGAGHNEAAEDLTNALRMLSEELYSKPTHFILELIQNADDNRYEDGVTPKLTILYRDDGYLWVGCNEVGFNEANVRAICRIAQSTKKVSGNQKGYIGEKGIGFKAVFKVANVVWIKSGAFSFKFGKAKPLGMIAPEWAEFPTHGLINERTMFCFRIPDWSNQDIVSAHLNELKPELLLFLRKLRSVKVTVEGPTRDSGQTKLSFLLERKDDQLSDIRRTTPSNNAVSPKGLATPETFLVFQRTEDHMPAEAKRPGVSESDLLMAFPVNDNMQPILRSRNTFNYLPIRTYGLPFVLQGDFILSASREDILQDNKWNNRIIAATLDLFVSSVQGFNRANLLQYQWPRFAKAPGGAFGTIFEGFFSQLQSKLQKSKVLLSQAGTLSMPPQLQTVPLPLTDGLDPPSPLLMTSAGLQTYVSTNYAAEDLAGLGVKVMTYQTFCTLLRSCIAASPAAFEARASKWHSRVAQAILRYGKNGVQRIEVIPLNGGRRTAPVHGNFYFPKVSPELDVPSGLEIATITEDAVRNESRRRLFAELGAITLDATHVFKIILQYHAQLESWRPNLSIEEAVSHARFLFTAPTRPRSYDMHSLWVYGADKRLRKASDLYMDDLNGTFRMSQTSAPTNSALIFLHPSYFRKLPARYAAAWTAWFKDVLKVNTIPKLLNSSGQLSDAFQWLMDQRPSKLWLRLLVDHWDIYSPAVNSIANQAVATKLRMAPVDCLDGGRHSLCDVYLPTPTIVREELATRRVPLLDVEYPEDPVCLSLSHIGLRTEPDLLFSLVALQGLASLPVTQMTLQQAKDIYRSISCLTQADTTLVRHIFQAKPLVYITAANKWVNLDRCRWTSPPFLSTLIGLRGLYPSFKELFVTMLGIRNANAVDIVNELTTLDALGGASIEDVAKAKILFLALSDRPSFSNQELEALGRMAPKKGGTGLQVFPIKIMGGAVDLRSTHDERWFIGDRKSLCNAFNGTVGLLDFDDEQLKKLSVLIDTLGLRSRFLSKRVTEETKATGESNFEPGLTDYVRTRARYVAALVQPAKRQAILDALLALEVKSSTRLVLKRYIRLPTGRVYGVDEEGDAILDQTDGHMRISVPSNLVDEGALPYEQLCDCLVRRYDVSEDQKMSLVLIFAQSSTLAIERQLEKKDLMHSVRALAEAPTTTKFVQKPGDDHSSAGESLEKVTSAVHPMAAQCKKENENHRPAAVSVPSRDVSSRQTNGGTCTPKVTSDRVTAGVDASSIMKAAVSFEKSSTRTLSSRPQSPPPTFSKREGGVKELPNFRNASPHPFNMNEMLSTLPIKSSRLSPSLSVAPLLASAPQPDDEWAQEIGSSGELFVYKFLTGSLHARSSCWTSHLREEHGLAPFTGLEANYADFTIVDLDASKAVTAWLGETGAETQRWADRDDVTYHIEVKATAGHGNAPFHFSHAQLELARRYHNCDTDVYVLLRVSDLGGTTPSCGVC